jgi:hypothetical protein
MEPGLRLQPGHFILWQNGFTAIATEGMLRWRGEAIL